MARKLTIRVHVAWRARARAARTLRIGDVDLDGVDPTPPVADQPSMAQGSRFPRTEGDFRRASGSIVSSGKSP